MVPGACALHTGCTSSLYPKDAFQSREESYKDNLEEINSVTLNTGVKQQRNTLKCPTTNVQGVWDFMPCPWLESSSVHGTCHGVWLIYPVTFHNLVFLIHDDNTAFSKQDTLQAIML